MDWIFSFCSCINFTKQFKACRKSRPDFQVILGQPSTKLSTRPPRTVKSTAISSATRSCRRRRPQHRSEVCRGLANSGEIGHRNERAEQRRERSRLAAQIRRNRESQSLMLLQNALPISTDVLGLHGIVTEAGELLSLFTREEDPLLMEELRMILNATNPEYESTHRCRQNPHDEQQSGIKRQLSESSTPGLSLTSGPASAVNLEKSDIIRIAGHTLFFLNHMRQYLGTTAAPTLSLQSRSLYGLIIDPMDMRIVYATPALAECIQWTWINLLGNSLNNVIQSNWDRSCSSTYNCPTINGSSSSKRKTRNTCLEDCEPECSSTASSSSSSGIGPVHAPSGPRTSSLSLPKSSAQQFFRLPDMFSIPRPARIDPVSCRTILAGLLDHIDPAGKQKLRQNRKTGKRSNSKFIASHVHLNPLETNDKISSMVNEPSDSSKFPRVFHCWYSTKLKFPSEQHMSTERYSYFPSSQSRSSKKNQGDDQYGQDAIGSSSDTEAAQQSDRMVESSSSTEQHQQNDTSRDQSCTDNDLLFCLFQPIPCFYRSDPSAPASVGLHMDVSSTSKGNGARESRGTRKKRPGRRRTSARAKRAPCPEASTENGSNLNQPMHSETDDELDSTARELITQLSQAELSSLKPETNSLPLCPCTTCILTSRDDHAVYCRMQLDRTGKILGVDGRWNQVDLQSDLIGCSYLSLVHLDDLNDVLRSVQDVLQNRSMAWTSIYRISVQRPNSAGCPILRPYQWVRSLLESTDDADVALHSWHQPVGASPDCVTWNGINLKAYSGPLIQDQDALQSSIKQSANLTNPLEMNGKVGTLSLSPTSTNPTSSEETSLGFESKALISAVGRTPATTVTTTNLSPSTPLSLPPGVRTLRIIQMPEEKRWTVEISSTVVPILRSPTGVPPIAHNLCSGTPCPPSAISRASAQISDLKFVKRGQKKTQIPRIVHHPSIFHGCDSHLQQQSTKLGGFNANMSPMLGVYSATRKDRRKVPILMRRRANPPTTTYQRLPQMVVISQEEWPTSSPSATFVETPLSNVSHGSSTSTCSSPLSGLSPAPWLSSSSASISTSFPSPSTEELAHVGLDEPPIHPNRAVTLETTDDQIFRNLFGVDQPLFGPTEETCVVMDELIHSRSTEDHVSHAFLLHRHVRISKWQAQVRVMAAFAAAQRLQRNLLPTKSRSQSTSPEPNSCYN
ncbi:hypothetical protein D915_000685 [Fasciola hepatica]|uniref:Uncharacterized protein n=1 Tax=Fasciola hepatica TaxID=6192 RepID=A0A4E0RLW7_FASHE|nr:hypothetical protein D915_000685 [Fasciola hepatica]